MIKNNKINDISDSDTSVVMPVYYQVARRLLVTVGIDQVA
ncbi:hypothetical protein NIES4071_24210 [Calothrix sp. NIES-4071]|nr:hypothetical protein NIES4071_24210 [Calothrix sp. NIES-4071]BAZ56744.1 hypothetical protein NIES4105_24150 [Calothrix sp. NIES-4105]